MFWTIGVAFDTFWRLWGKLVGGLGRKHIASKPTENRAYMHARVYNIYIYIERERERERERCVYIHTPTAIRNNYGGSRYWTSLICVLFFLYCSIIFYSLSYAFEYSISYHHDFLLPRGEVHIYIYIY